MPIMIIAGLILGGSFAYLQKNSKDKKKKGK